MRPVCFVLAAGLPADLAPVADGGETGEAFDLHNEAEEIGYGAADACGLDVAQSRLAGIHAFCEITISH